MSRGRRQIELGVAAAALATALLGPVVAGAASSPAGAVPAMASVNAIACQTSARCVAVGVDASENGKTAVVNTASAAATSWPGDLSQHVLESIACATTTVCAAVASDVTVSVTASTGAARIVSTLHAPTNEIVALGSIACPSASSCYAVGFEGTEVHSKAMLAHVSAGGTVLSTSLEASSTGFASIACTSTTTCLVAAADGTGVEKIQLLTNGHLGAARALPAKTFVQDLACFGTKSCLALAGKVGSNRPNELLTLNPTTGALESSATIGGSFSGNELACSSATVCIVTGFRGPEKPQIDIVTKGKPAAPRAIGGIGVGGIGCTKAGVCFAVGQSTTTEGLVLKV